MSTNTVGYRKQRLPQLQKIKNPTDYTKHQIKSAKTRINEFRVKRNESLHSSKKPAPKTDSRGRVLKSQPKVDRSVRLPSNYKEEEAKMFEAANKDKTENVTSETKTKVTPQVKTDENKSTGTTTAEGNTGKSKTKEELKINKNKVNKNKVKIKGETVDLNPQEWHGRSQASGKNSIAKQAWLRKKRKALAAAAAKANAKK